MQNRLKALPFTCTQIGMSLGRLRVATNDHFTTALAVNEMFVPSCPQYSSFQRYTVKKLLACAMNYGYYG